MDSSDVNQTRLHGIFFQKAGQRLQIVKTQQRRFVHYTSADVALSILRKKEIWMRRVTTMNDRKEVRHGADFLRQAWNSEPGSAFKAVLEQIKPGVHAQLEKLLNDWLPHFEFGTYLTCVSEHCTGKEDKYGRLSMWRAYGGQTGIAIVLNNLPFLGTSDALKVYSSPVEYLDYEDFTREFLNIVTAMQREVDFLRTSDSGRVFNSIFHMLRFAVLCTKHPAFAEELEWRVVHTPALDQSKRLRYSIESVRGVPQEIYKIPLENVTEEGLIGVALPELIERVIIGPTEFKDAIFDAFFQELTSAGVDPRGKIILSDIPVR